MKAIYGLLLAMLAVTTSAGAQDARAEFESGNYARAAQTLETQLATAPPTAERFSNLGLAYEKAGEPARAALSYQRALLLDPTSKTARNQFAALAATHGIPLPPRSWTADVNAVVHPETLVMGGVLLFWLGAFGLLLVRQNDGRKSGRTVLAAVALVLGAGAFAMGWLTDARLTGARPAMVSGKEGAELLTAPASNSDVVASLPEGAPVGVLSPRGSWAFVLSAAGAKGWVQSDRLTPIVPGEKF